MASTPAQTFSTDKLTPVYPKPMAPKETVKLPASIHYLKGTLLGELIGNNEQQTVTLGGSPVGTFTLTFGAQTTSAISVSATAAQVQAALEALSTIGTGNVSVSGSNGGPYTVVFQNALGYQNVAQMTKTDPSGGGTTTVATSVGGSSGTRGTFKAYQSSATDGSQIPKCFLERECATDGSGNITYGDTAGAGGYVAAVELVTPAFFGGAFKTTDLVQVGPGALDANAVTVLGGHLASGSIADGVFAF